MPRATQDRFFGRPAPPRERPLLVATTRTSARFALAIFGCGFLGALLYQLAGLGYLVPLLAAQLAGGPAALLVSVILGLQLVSLLQAAFAVLALGAPVFEEFFKVGLALLVCVPLLRLAESPARGLVLIIRIVVAAAVGALFGWSEHFLYSSEDTISYMSRLTFHSGAAALSMTTYSVLERVPDTRARWFSTIPSSFLHYANNGFGIFVALILGEGAATFWSVGLSISTVVAIPLVAGFRRPLRDLVAHQAAKRFHTPWGEPGRSPAPAPVPAGP